MKSRECDAIIDVLDNLLKEKRLGWQCFKDAAKHVTAPDVSKLFEKLTLEETDHIEVLMKEKDRMEELKVKFDSDEYDLE